MAIISEAFLTGVVSRTKGSLPDNQKDPLVKFHIFRHITTAAKDGSVDAFQTYWDGAEAAVLGFQLANYIPSQYLMKFRTDLNIKPRIWTKWLRFKFRNMMISNGESDPLAMSFFRNLLYAEISLRLGFNQPIFDCFSATSDSSFFVVYVFLVNFDEEQRFVVKGFI